MVTRGAQQWEGGAAGEHWNTGTKHKQVSQVWHLKWIFEALKSIGALQKLSLIIQSSTNIKGSCLSLWIKSPFRFNFLGLWEEGICNANFPLWPPRGEQTIWHLLPHGDTCYRLHFNSWLGLSIRHQARLGSDNIIKSMIDITNGGAL